MKFRAYSYGKKIIDTFLHKIKETFGENILIGYGNIPCTKNKNQNQNTKYKN
jgi:hypothetical protein